MEAWVAILVLWIAFTGTHVALSSPSLRDPLVARLREGGFQAFYSLVALATFVPLVWVYMESRHAGPLLWGNPLGLISLWVFDVALAIGVGLMVAGFAQPSPASIAGPRAGSAHGVHRITRHAVFMGFGIVGALHLIPNGYASDVVFFGGLPLFVLIGCRHQDQRKRAGADPALQAWLDATPFLPFTGADTARGLREIPLWVIGLGIAVTVGLRWLHGPLFR